MRRRTILECSIETTEALLDRLTVLTHNLKRLDHGLRQMVADAARGDLEAVAYNIVLECLDRQGILGRQRIDAALRHRERVMAEVDHLLLLVPFIERKVDDPAKFKAVAVDEVELLAGTSTRASGKAREFFGVARYEE